MEMQGFVNTLFGVMMTIILALIGVIYSSFKGRQDKYENEIDKIKDKVHEVNNVVSGEYIKRSEVNDHMKEIKDELKAIFDKLEGKANK